MPCPTPYECAKEFVTHTNRNLFITGKAGTGKTTFLREFRAETMKQTAVVAPTGVAAVNAGGATIHSFFQLPFTPFTPTPSGRESLIAHIKMNNSRRRVLRELEVLIIDEVSMVRADVLDAIDTVLRSVRHRQSDPFGGVQMIFIGDMYQLSPVVKADEWRIFLIITRVSIFPQPRHSGTSTGLCGIRQDLSPVRRPFYRSIKPGAERFAYTGRVQPAAKPLRSAF